MGQDGERTSWFVAVDLYDILFGLRTGISTRWFLKREETKTLRKAESAQYALSSRSQISSRPRPVSIPYLRSWPLQADPEITEERSPEVPELASPR
ncbi:hypothetical protein BV91_02335, partial [Brucella melitensis]